MRAGTGTSPENAATLPLPGSDMVITAAAKQPWVAEAAVSDAGGLPEASNDKIGGAPSTVVNGNGVVLGCMLKYSPSAAIQTMYAVPLAKPVKILQEVWTVGR